MINHARQTIRRQPETLAPVLAVAVLALALLGSAQAGTMLIGNVDIERYVEIECVPNGTALTTGTGKCFWGISKDLTGLSVVSVAARLGEAVSSSGVVTITLDRCAAVATGAQCSGSTAAVLGTSLTIDANESSSETAATPAVITPANAVLATDQWLRWNVTGAGTGAKGLYVVLTLRRVP